MNLESKLESVLFFKGEAMSFKKLSEILGVGKREVKNIAETLRKNLDERNAGITLIQIGDEVMLGTSSENSEMIENLRKEEFSKTLGRAGIETLTIILYLNPVSKPQIDFIRGVNSVTIIRNLLVRGLIKRINNPKNNRSYLYVPTTDTLSCLGVNSMENLPEYENIRKTLVDFEFDKTDDTIS